MPTTVNDMHSKRTIFSPTELAKKIAIVRVGPKMLFFETAIDAIHPGAIDRSSSEMHADRYFLIVSVCDFHRIGISDGPGAILGGVTDIQISDVRCGRAQLILDLSNEGPTFSRDLFDAFHRHLESCNLPRRNITFICQNRRLGTDYAEAFGSGGINFRSLDFFPSTMVVHFDNALGNADFGLYTPMSGQEDKIFNSLNAAPRWHRILLFLWLKRTGWLKDGLVSFHGIGESNPKTDELDLHHPPPVLVSAFPDLMRDFLDDLPRTPLRFDKSDVVGNQLSTSIVVEAFERSLVSIVAESDFFTKTVRVTEKTFKTAMMGHPFIVVGPPDSVAFMRRLGFRTFDQLIDHAYDEIEDDVERMQACLVSIEACFQKISEDRAAWVIAAREDALFNFEHARKDLRLRLDDLVVSPLLAEMAAFIERGAVIRAATSPLSAMQEGERMSAVFASLSLLTPYEIDRPKVRIGPNADGGYILAETLDPGQTVLSYGISTEYRFDEAMAERGHRVFMFDHTIQPLATIHPHMHFFAEGVAGTSDGAQRLYSIEDHLKKNQIAGDNLILKMDVEGAEFEALNALSPATLARFEQIVMEVHGIDQLGDDAFRLTFNRTFSRLNEYFTLFHVHANNYDGSTLTAIGKIPAVSMMELSYMRSDRITRRPNETLYPCALDYPCTNNADKLLWFYPFMPTSVSPQNFADCLRRSETLQQRLEVLKAKTARHFDVDWYKSEYSDLAECDDEYLRYHFFNHGILEGRFGARIEKEGFEKG